MENKLSFIILFMVFFLGCGVQKELPIEKSASHFVHNFFNMIQQENYRSAIDSLIRSNKYIDYNDSSSIKIKNEFIALNQGSGKFLGYVLLKKRNIGNDIVVYSYLAKYDIKFYRFIFIFYNTGEVVRLNKFAYDDNITIELEESLKLYYKE